MKKTGVSSPAFNRFQFIFFACTFHPLLPLIHSLSARMPKHDTYQRHSLTLLKCSFPRLSVRAIEQTFKIEHNFSFIPSFNALRDIRNVIPNDLLDNGEDEAVRALILEVAPFLYTVNPIVIKHERQLNRVPRKLNHRLLQEMSRVDDLNEGNENLLPLKGQPKEAEEEDALHDDGETLECGCCMDDILAAQMVHCNALPPNRHSFCKTCLRQHIHEQLYGKNQTNVPCMSITSCDKGIFEDDKFDGVLTPRTLKNYSVLRAQEVVKAAGVNLWYVYSFHSSTIYISGLYALAI